jgi:hypothetical protein
VKRFACLPSRGCEIKDAVSDICDSRAAGFAKPESRAAQTSVGPRVEQPNGTRAFHPPDSFVKNRAD